jgi:phosphoribosyl-AMP cyclohydrolase
MPNSTTSAAANASWLKKVRWDENGLVPVIAQEASSGDILMFAWMNRDALARTAELGEAVYWSRSRKKLWHKGEESGHTQKVLEMRLDCDEDVVCSKSSRPAASPAIPAAIPASSRNSTAKTGKRSIPVLQDPETIYTNTKKTP